MVLKFLELRSALHSNYSNQISFLLPRGGEEAIFFLERHNFFMQKKVSGFQGGEGEEAISIF